MKKRRRNRRCKWKEGKVDRQNSAQARVADEVEERKLQEMLIAKKHKRAYQKIRFGEKRKAKEVSGRDVLLCPVRFTGQFAPIAIRPQ